MKYRSIRAVSQINSQERAQFSVAEGRAQSKQKIGHLIVLGVTQCALQQINPIRGSSLSGYACIAVLPNRPAVFPCLLKFTFSA